MSDSDDSQSDQPSNNKKKNGAGNSKEPVKKKAFRLSDLGSSSESSDFEDRSSPIDQAPEMETPYQSLDASEAVRQTLLDSSTSDTEPLSDLDLKNRVDEIQMKTELSSESETMKSTGENNAESTPNLKMEKDDENSNESLDGQSKERDRSLSPETAKLLRDPISAGNKKSNESDEKPVEGKRKSRDKRKRRIVDSDSDFQSSGSGKEEKQKSKRKKVHSSDEDFEDDEANDSRPKRRRRIKKVASSDSEASDDSDIEILNESQRSDGGAGKGRKNIKKIMKDTSLKVSSIDDYILESSHTCIN